MHGRFDLGSEEDGRELVVLPLWAVELDEVPLVIGRFVVLQRVVLAREEERHGEGADRRGHRNDGDLDHLHVGVSW